MGRGGKREGAGRRSTVNKITRLLAGARANTLLDYREVAPISPYFEIARDVLHAIPIEKRGGYPNPKGLLRWIQGELDKPNKDGHRLNRCISGKALTVKEVIEIVAKEFELTPRQVRAYLEWYRRNGGF